MGLIIRDFKPEDRERYIALSEEFYSSKAVDHDVPKVHFSRTFDRCVNRDPFVRGIAFEYDDVFAGFALIALTWSNEAGGMCAWLEEAYIVPQYQGKSIGSAYFDFLAKEYEGKIKRFRLEVSPSNDRAVNLYKRMGFSFLDYRQMYRDLPD